MNPRVKKATLDQNYTVHLIFDNGEEGKIKVLGNKRELIDGESREQGRSRGRPFKVRSSKKHTSPLQKQFFFFACPSSGHLGTASLCPSVHTRYFNLIGSRSMYS
ncbi:MAG: hypothetical protein Q7J10_07050 [Methanosarcinaceae archaeon]|nr:hypothetical protein [Methanosarcinaceae archaeon]